MGSTTSAEEYEQYSVSQSTDYVLGRNQTLDDYTGVLEGLEGQNETITNGTTDYGTPRVGYSTLYIIVASIILTFMMIVVVIGNMLVIIAIATEKTLKNVQNWFIASLAVADFFVGLLIMPFSLANELMGYWIFGKVWCSIHSALDVLLCTSSIMNICLISLDRYWSITQAIEYLKKRTPVRAAVMITMVWILSALISIPPLMGWRDETDSSQDVNAPTCELSKKIGYVLYSAMGSFYIPSVIMVFVYIRIYYAARDRARRAIRKPPRPKPQSSTVDTTEDTTKVTTNFSTKSSSPKVPLSSSSSPPHLVTSPVEMNAVPKDSMTSPGTTESGRTVKQVGFQEPLVSCSSDDMPASKQPEIMVESCSPEDSLGENGGGGGGGGEAGGGEVEVFIDGAKEEKIVQVTVEDVHNDTETETELSSKGVTETGRDEGTGKISKREGEKEESTEDKIRTILTAATTTKSVTEPSESRRGSSCRKGKSVEIETKDKNTNPPNPPTDAHAESNGSSGNIHDSVERVPHHSALAVSELETRITALQSNGGNRSEEITTVSSSVGTINTTTTTTPSPAPPPPPTILDTRRASKRPKLHFLRVEPPTIWRTNSSLSLNGDVHILGTLSRSCSRLQLEADPVSDVDPSSSDSGAVSRCAVVKPLKLRLCQPFFGKKFSSSSSSSGKARRDVLDMGKLNSPKVRSKGCSSSSATTTTSTTTTTTTSSAMKPPALNVPYSMTQEIRDPEREKRRIARKKEKRATLILGLIMGSFILCWLPFFFLYIFEPLCNCYVAPWGFAIAFWLGYLNSALNPVIYTIFNKDFRRAFRRILFK